MIKIKNNWKELLYERAYREKWSSERVELMVNFIEDMTFKFSHDISLSTTQCELLEFIKDNSPCPLKWTRIGEKTGIGHPEKVKNNILRLANAGKIRIEDKFAIFIENEK